MIMTRVTDSLLVRRLLAALPQIRERLKDTSAWQGIRVYEPGLAASYVRVFCADELVTARQVYRVAVHLFEQLHYDGRMHDHRWPLAVLPMDLDGERGATVYEMEWQVRSGASGMIRVRDREPWAIELHTQVLHRVRTLRPHLSIVLVDVTKPAARESRLLIEPYEPLAAVLKRAQALLALPMPGYSSRK